MKNAFVKINDERKYKPKMLPYEHDPMINELFKNARKNKPNMLDYEHYPINKAQLLSNHGFQINHNSIKDR